MNRVGGVERIVPFSHPAAMLGAWRVEVDANRLVRDGAEVSLAPKVMLLLRCLMARPNQVISRQVLLESAWPESDVGEEVLTQSIAELRRALGESARDGLMVATIRKTGYQLRTLVTPISDAPVASGNGSVPLPLRVDTDAPTTNPPFAARVDDVPTLGEHAPRKPSLRGVARWFMAAAAVVVMALLFARMPLTRAPDPGPAPGPASAAAAALFTKVLPLTAEIGSETMPAMSPDGSQVAYLALTIRDDGGLDEQLMLRALGASVSRILATSDVSPGFLRSPAWSSDGRRIAFMRVNGSHCHIAAIAVLGDSTDEKTLGECESLEERRSFLAWSLDDHEIAFSRHTDPARPDSEVRLHLLNATTGEVTLLAHEPVPGQSRMPRYSPDGKSIAFLQGTTTDEAVFVVASGGGTPRRISRQSGGVRGMDWLSDGDSVIYSLKGQFRRVSLDGASDVALDLRDGVQPSLARDKPAMVFVSLPPSAMNLRRYRLDPADSSGERNAQPGALLFASTRISRMPRWSPQGDAIAFVSDRTGSLQAWTGSSNGTDAQPLSALEAGERVEDIAWMPDGKRIALALTAANGSGRAAIYARSGPGAEIIYRSAEAIRAIAVDASGSAVYVARTSSTSPLLRISTSDARIDEVPLRDVQRIAVTDAGVLVFSRVGDTAIYRADPPDFQARRLPGTELAVEASGWSVHGEGVIFWAAVEYGEALMLASLQRSEPARFFTGMTGTFAQRDFSLSPDGTELVFPVDDPRAADLMTAQP
ncbi:MAG: winged helix-turn-helix domain-containing protein [Tahibacter sp.]